MDLPAGRAWRFPLTGRAPGRQSAASRRVDDQDRAANFILVASPMNRRTSSGRRVEKEMSRTGPACPLSAITILG